MANASTYTDEYRLECADRVISSGKPATQVAGEPGVHCKTLQHWARKRRDQLEGEAEGEANPAGVKALRKRIREPGQENGFPRKAGAFFAAGQARQANTA